MTSGLCCFTEEIARWFTQTDGVLAYSALEEAVKKLCKLGRSVFFCLSSSTETEKAKNLYRVILHP